MCSSMPPDHGGLAIADAVHVELDGVFLSQYKMAPAAVEKLLIKESGLLGISGIS